MSLLAEPIDEPAPVGHKAKARLARAGNAKPGVDQKSIRAPVVLAVTVQDFSLTSEIFSPCFGKGWFAAVCKGYRGARKRLQSV